jgi:hypothetical protein
MKLGDKIPVTIAGQTVTQAEVRELADGTVTLVFPATRVVMATRTELSTAPVVEERSTQTIIDGVDRVGQSNAEDVSSNVSEQPRAEEAKPETSENVSTETPVVENKEEAVGEEK